MFPVKQHFSSRYAILDVGRKKLLDEPQKWSSLEFNKLALDPARHSPVLQSYFGLALFSA